MYEPITSIKVSLETIFFIFLLFYFPNQIYLVENKIFFIFSLFYFLNQTDS